MLGKRVSRTYLGEAYDGAAFCGRLVGLPLVCLIVAAATAEVSAKHIRSTAHYFWMDVKMTI